jgi:hypothetical protein
MSQSTTTSMEKRSAMQGGMTMFSTLTTGYMAGEVERELLESKATRQRLIDEAMEANTGHTLAFRLRHRLGALLVTTGERLEGPAAPVYRSSFDDSLHPAR